jgi:hypothetical protein
MRTRSAAAKARRKAAAAAAVAAATAESQQQEAAAAAAASGEVQGQAEAVHVDIEMVAADEEEEAAAAALCSLAVQPDREEVRGARLREGLRMGFARASVGYRGQDRGVRRCRWLQVGGMVCIYCFLAGPSSWHVHAVPGPFVLLPL